MSVDGELKTLKALKPEPVLSPSLIEYQTRGDPAHQAVVLVHGMHSSLETFLNTADDLAAEGFFVVLFSQRGHGTTPDVGWDYSLTLLAQDLCALLDHLGLTQKVVVLGHSFGAKTALRFAALCPSRVSKVVIEDMDMKLRHNHDLEEEARTVRNAEREKAMTPLLFDSIEHVQEHEGRVREDKLIKTPEGKLQLKYRPYVVSLYGYYCTVEDQTGDLKVLSRHQIPLLVIGAGLDETAISPGGREHFERHCKLLTYVVVHEAGHTVHRTKRRIFNIHLLKFLRQTASNI